MLESFLTSYLVYIPAIVFFLLFTLLYIMNPKWLKVAWRMWGILFFLGLNITLYKYIVPSNWNTVTVIEGVDKKNAKAKFKIQMLNDKFSWNLGSSEIVQLNGENIDIRDYLRSSETLNEFYSSSEIICVGNSSHEGTTFTEERRAERRGKKFAEWIKSVLPPEKNQHVLVLNLGHNKVSVSNSSSQRRLIVILVIKKDPGVNLSEALEDAIHKNSRIFPLDITEYSMFTLQ